MTTHHHKRRKATLWLLALIYPVAWLVSELRWTHINDPTDRFTNVTRYLAGSRQPSRVTRVRLEKKTYYIAYSPTDSWLATPSSPAAYVFDDQGKMVEWSADPGDDLAFQSKWPHPQHDVATSELSQLGAEQ